MSLVGDLTLMYTFTVTAVTQYISILLNTDVIKYYTPTQRCCLIFLNHMYFLRFLMQCEKNLFWLNNMPP